MIAAWIFALSDYFMDIQGMFDERFYRPFIGMPHGVALYGSISMLAFPCLALGLGIILRASRLHKMVPVMFYYLLTIPMIIHTSFIYYYYVVNDSAAVTQHIGLLARFDAYKNVFGAIYFIGLLIISFSLFVQILRAHSLFPRSFALLNPLVGVALLYLLRLFLPTLASFIYPLLVPASFLAFFVTACSIYLCAKPEKLEQIGPATII